jgi:hypothetical protein
MIEVDRDLEYLRSCAPSRSRLTGREIAIVDSFSGCGGLTLGAIEGARRSGRPASLALAVDLERDPLTVLRGAVDCQELRGKGGPRRDPAIRLRTVLTMTLTEALIAQRLL